MENAIHWEYFWLVTQSLPFVGEGMSDEPLRTSAEEATQLDAFNKLSGGQRYSTFEQPEPGHHLGTEIQKTLPWGFYHFTCKNTN